MPELSRFYGIIIRMYMEAGGQHHSPHFHAYYQEEAAVFSIDPIDMIAGRIPRNQRAMVEEWADRHREELLIDWDLLQSGQPPNPIDPLE